MRNRSSTENENFELYTYINERSTTVTDYNYNCSEMQANERFV